MNAPIDFWRQLDFFDPASFDTPIHIIGAGATGSYVAWLLAKTGCRDITVYDFDKVEDHNLPNQIFDLESVGAKKVDALGRMIEAATGIGLKKKPRRFKKGKLEGIVFVLTDTMASRKEIWEGSLRYQLNVKLVIETRMAIDGGYVYAVEPTDPTHVEEYEATFYSDEEAEESPCSNRAIAPTVAVLAGYAACAMLAFVNGKPFPNETMISLVPPCCVTRDFS